MAWTLGDTTLPTPTHYEFDYLEKGATHTTQTNKTVKDIRGRKKQYTLQYDNLSSTEYANIISEYDKKTAVNFTASDTTSWGSISVSTVSVHVDIRSGRIRHKEGYMPELTLILTEVE